MKCPVDHNDLKSFKSEDISLNQCGVCHGVWIPYTALQKFANLHSLKVPFNEGKFHIRNSEDSARIVCPEDCSQTFALQYQGLEIDICKQCGGVWLDRGELEEILNSSKKSHNQNYGQTAADIATNFPEIIYYGGKAAIDAAETLVEFMFDAASSI